MKKVKEFEEYFLEKWHKETPLAKLFKTDSHFYFFDTGTNKIMRCDKDIFNLLDKLFSMDAQMAIMDYIHCHGTDKFLYAAEKVRSVIEIEKVFSLTEAKNFGYSTDVCYKDLLDSSIEMITLELTERCNLNCKYCIYADHVKSKRNHGTRNMNRDIAFKALDYYKAHSYKNNNHALGFYGGEPMLQYPLLKECVNFARENFENKTLSLWITTNATLIDEEIAEFLLLNNFTVTVSIDGPEEIHDHSRIDLGGKGTFKRTLKGLHYLVDVYGEKAKENLILSMVYTPPFSSSRLNRLTQLWQEVDWLPREIPINITYPSKSSILPDETFQSFKDEDYDLECWSFEQFSKTLLDKVQINPIAQSVIERNLALLMQRPIYDVPNDCFSLNGCCIPGKRKLYVAVDGTFHICERMPSDSPIGNVFDGIDYQLIDDVYLQEYRSVNYPYCSRCWAVGICSVCYSDITSMGKMDIVERQRRCPITRASREKYLAFMCSLLEKNPEILNYLYDFKLG